MYKALVVLFVSVLITACTPPPDTMRIPTKETIRAEDNIGIISFTYDLDKIKKIAIPSNCEVISITKSSTKSCTRFLLRNDLGDYYIFSVDISSDADHDGVKLQKTLPAIK